MGIKYSAALSSFAGLEPVEQTLVRLKEQQFDAAEMYGEPDKVDISKFRETADSCGLPICGITGMWGRSSPDGWKRKLLSQDQEIVRHSENYVKKCVEMCRHLGGGEFNVCLFADDRNEFDSNHSTISESNKKSKMEKAAPLLESLARFASDRGVKLLIEPLNRYSTPYCNNARDALYMAEKANHESVGVLLDTFHMNIEEASFERAILDSGDKLGHMHFADNNRTMPGSGHIDFGPVMEALRSISYGKFVSFETNFADSDWKSATLAGLHHVKSLENNTCNKAQTNY